MPVSPALPRAERPAARPFRMFAVEVAGNRRLSPSFTRVTFRGDDLDRFADNGYDQRLKLILPVPVHGLSALPTGEDWYDAWRRLPEDRKNPVRTYTVRAVRPRLREVDVDLVLHGDPAHAGPAGRFAALAAPGDRAVLLGPDADYPGRHGGLEFRPPRPGDHRRGSASSHLLLAGDETALPAIANIVSALPTDARGHVVVEVPHPDDRLDLDAPEGVDVVWGVRGSQTHGASLLRLVLAADLPPARGTGPAEPGETGSAEELLWDVPASAEADCCPPLYAWVAGEASTVRAVRRHLVGTLGHDRRCVAFMGYWRLGRAEA